MYHSPFFSCMTMKQITSPCRLTIGLEIITIYTHTGMHGELQISILEYHEVYLSKISQNVLFQSCVTNGWKC